MDIVRHLYMVIFVLRERLDKTNVRVEAWTVLAATEEEALGVAWKREVMPKMDTHFVDASKCHKIEDITIEAAYKELERGS